MSDLTHIHPRLTPEDIIARAFARAINEYYREVFAEPEEEEEGSPHRADDHVSELGWGGQE